MEMGGGEEREYIVVVVGLEKLAPPGVSGSFKLQPR